MNLLLRKIFDDIFNSYLFFKMTDSTATTQVWYIIEY